MDAFKWNPEDKHWYLFDSNVGIYCYLFQLIAPVIPGTEHKASDMSRIYTFVQASIDENGEWNLKADPFNNIYTALEYSEEVLGYLPKFRDPNEDVYYSTKEKKC